jgi:hypothetical protein
MRAATRERGRPAPGFANASALPDREAQTAWARS